MLRLLRSKKAQATVEYGVLFGVIVALAAGVLTISLKNAMQSKQEKGIELLLSAGTTELNAEIAKGAVQDLIATTEEVRDTTSVGGSFKDDRVRLKSGAEQAWQMQETKTDQSTAIAGTAGF